MSIDLYIGMNNRRLLDYRRCRPRAKYDLRYELVYTAGKHEGATEYTLRLTRADVIKMLDAMEWADSEEKRALREQDDREQDLLREQEGDSAESPDV